MTIIKSAHRWLKFLIRIISGFIINNNNDFFFHLIFIFNQFIHIFSSERFTHEIERTKVKQIAELILGHLMRCGGAASRVQSEDDWTEDEQKRLILDWLTRGNLLLARRCKVASRRSPLKRTLRWKDELCLLKHTQIINVWCHPSSIRELLQVVGSFMVAADEDCQDRSFLLSWIISERKQPTG